MALRSLSETAGVIPDGAVAVVGNSPYFDSALDRGLQKRLALVLRGCMVLLEQAEELQVASLRARRQGVEQYVATSASLAHIAQMSCVVRTALRLLSPSPHGAATSPLRCLFGHASSPAAQCHLRAASQAISQRIQEHVRFGMENLKPLPSGGGPPPAHSFPPGFALPPGSLPADGAELAMRAAEMRIMNDLTPPAIRSAMQRLPLHCMTPEAVMAEWAAGGLLATTPRQHWAPPGPAQQMFAQFAAAAPRG